MAKASNNLDFRPAPALMRDLQKQSKTVVSLIKKHAKKQRCKLDVFLGGSFAKDTIVSKKVYDIDIFIRLNKVSFDKDIQKLQKITQDVAKELNSEIKIVHGSRDYYQISSNKSVIFEIIPVLKIKKPEEAENVTDLSYFHVNFIRRKLNTDKLRNQVRLAKTFCAASDTYGAESYIQGFSGYALECLMVHYKSFEKMLKDLSKAQETVIIDSERHYKNKKEILIQLNESKLQSPVIVIDPTWKKRNALASLNKETFLRFQKHAQGYLKSKSHSYFEIKEISTEQLTAKALKLNQELAIIELKTDKQEGDIAGTKMKKASNYIIAQLSKEYDVKEHYFSYDDAQSANLYLIGKPKKELLLQGPPISMKEHAAAFRKEHTATFEKKGKIFAKKQVSLSLRDYCKDKIEKDSNLGLMSVTGIRVI
jgi:tRNA nucleotidyltransferase (CCA-adding enzyme)